MVGVALFFGFVTLGTWQVQRRVWKLDLMERVEQRLHATPQSLGSVAAAAAASSDPRAQEYQPVHATGQWIPGKTVFAQALTAIGSGFWVLSAMQTEDGRQVLVNRGFVPDTLVNKVPLEPTANGSVRIEGLMRVSEPGGGFLRENNPANNKWYSRDVAAIATRLELQDALPFFIDLGIPSNAHVNADAPAPAANGPWPQAGMTVVKFHNSHAVYALTWYGLALMVLLAAWLVVRHERRENSRTGA